MPAPGHGPAAEAQAGILTLDVYAQGDVLDLLVTEAAAEGLGLRHRRSRDGGATWRPEHAVDLGGAGIAFPHRGSDAQIAAAGERLVALWTAPGTSPWGTGPLASSISEDGGRTWRPDPSPADSRSTGGHGWALSAAGANATQPLVVPVGGAFRAFWTEQTPKGETVWASAAFGEEPGAAER